LYPLYSSYSLVCAVFEQPWMLANEIFFSNRRLLRHVSYVKLFSFPRRAGYRSSSNIVPLPHEV
jgi:hypothetical protein